jgi:hypothetical protein
MVAKDIASSVKKAYTKLGNRFNLKGALEAFRSKDTAEDAKETSFECPNEDCLHVFKSPLRVLQIQRGRKVDFYACPRCLSEITVDDDSVSPDLDEEDNDDKKGVELEQVLPPETSSGCRHHLGYLGERDSKAGIPDECMICKDLMDCMHKKVKK